MFKDYYMYIGQYMYIVETDEEDYPLSITIADEKRNKTMTFVLDWDCPRQLHELADMVINDGEIDDHSEDYGV